VVDDNAPVHLDKQSWRRAIKSPKFPAKQRAIRATLLIMSDLMAADGSLCRWRRELVEATGLPERTVNRHLARAVKEGWLAHAAHGGHGRRGTYQAALPVSCGPLMADNFPKLRAI
jgi:hypothetical protein